MKRGRSKTLLTISGFNFPQSRDIRKSFMGASILIHSAIEHRKILFRIFFPQFKDRKINWWAPQIDRFLDWEKPEFPRPAALFFPDRKNIWRMIFLKSGENLFLNFLTKKKLRNYPKKSFGKKKMKSISFFFIALIHRQDDFALEKSISNSQHNEREIFFCQKSIKSQ